MTESLTLSALTAQVDTLFRVHAVDLRAELTLTQVTDRGSSAQFEQFSAQFHGPLAPFLPQGMYRVQHEWLGTFDLFLVPTGQQADGFQYLASFSRFIK